MEKYLPPNDLKITQTDAQLIFKLRCRMTDVKTNFKGIYDSLECDLCKNDTDNQKHILECPEF